jgi:hypothetical protein
MVELHMDRGRYADPDQTPTVSAVAFQRRDPALICQY